MVSQSRVAKYLWYAELKSSDSSKKDQGGDRFPVKLNQMLGVSVFVL